MEIIYRADGNREFDNEYECEAYEESAETQGGHESSVPLL